MITNLKPTNMPHLINEVHPILEDILLEYDIAKSNMLILDIIAYLELYLNCTLRKMEVTYTTERNNIVLPLWPICKILSVKAIDNSECDWTMEGNNLQIRTTDTKKHFTIIYEVGYSIEVLKYGMPLKIICLGILDHTIKSHKSQLCKDLEKLLSQLRDIYGKGDAY